MGFEGRECSCGLLYNNFSDACKCSVVEGKDTAKDVGRNKHFLKLVHRVHKRARFGDNWQFCQKQTSNMMKEGAADEVQQCITNMSWEARQQRLEDRSVSHKTLVERLRVSAEGEAKMPHQITKPTLWRGEASWLKKKPKRGC